MVNTKETADPGMWLTKISETEIEKPILRLF